MTASFGSMLFAYLMQAINLQNLPFNLLWLLSVPVILYLLISRLRYLGKVRTEHNQIFEASLSGSPCTALKDLQEQSAKPEHTVIAREQPLFPDTLAPRLHQELKAS